MMEQSILQTTLALFSTTKNWLNVAKVVSFGVMVGGFCRTLSVRHFFIMLTLIMKPSLRVGILLYGGPLHLQFLYYRIKTPLRQSFVEPETSYQVSRAVCHTKAQ